MPMQAEFFTLPSGLPQHFLHASALIWLCEYVAIRLPPPGGFETLWRAIIFYVPLCLHCLDTWNSRDVWEINE